MTRRMRSIVMGLGLSVGLTTLLAWGATSFFLTGKGVTVHQAYFKQLEVCLEPFADRLELSVVKVRPIDPASVPGGQGAWTGEPEYRMPGAVQLYHPLENGGLSGVWAVFGHFRNGHRIAFNGQPFVEIDGALSGQWRLRGYGDPNLPEYFLPEDLVAQTFMREAIDAPCPRPDVMAVAEAPEGLMRQTLQATTPMPLAGLHDGR